MPLERLQRISELWNWLPAFRAVAEYENVHKAAAALRVSPSALSRTVRLLEEAVGERLFIRSAAGLALTPAGVVLLQGTRDAMRRVDDAVSAAVREGTREGIFRGAAVGGILTRLLDRAICLVLERLPELEYRGSVAHEDTASAELLRGNLDFVLVDELASLETHDDLVTESLGTLGFAMFAPPNGDPATQSGESVVTIAGVRGLPIAGRSRVTVETVDSAESIAERRSLLAELPTALAPASWTCVSRCSVSISVCALYRKPLGDSVPAPITMALEAVRSCLRTDGA
jgi:DNA-binding transcriptional LysR family regulator